MRREKYQHFFICICEKAAAAASLLTDAMNENPTGPDKGTPDGAGHRDRLRQKFLNGGLAAFLDYEIVELLLTLGTPRRDCKAQAREALREFQPFGGVLAACPGGLPRVLG